MPTSSDRLSAQASSSPSAAPWSTHDHPAISSSRLTKSFGPHTVLHSIDLSIAHGEVVALVGKSGSGKSTLLRCLAGLDVEFEGTVTRPDRVSVGFQDARLLPWAHVWKNVVLGDRDDRNLTRHRAEAALGEVELTDKLDAWPSELSGGQQQRVSLARALYRRPRALFLDEPFGALDALTRLNMQSLVLELWKHHAFTTVIVTHEVSEAITLADRIVVLSDGRIADDIPVGLPRPRSHRAPEFGDIREHVLRLLGVQVP